MAESEEAKRSESVLGAELQSGESSSRRTREGVEERIRGLQFSSDEEGGGRGGPVLRDSEGGAPSPTPPLQTQGGADDELDGAPVIRADDEEEEEEDDWDMDTGETPDCAVDMETDKRTDSDRRTEPQSDRLAGERSRPQSEGSDTGAPTKTPAPGPLGTAFISAEARRPPVADVEMSAVEESVGDRRVQDTPLSRATDPSLGGAVLSQCESRGSRRQGEDTPVSISPPQPGVLRIREMESGSVEGGCFFPPVDIKDEPIDEEYDRALAPQPPPRRIKDEPDASEDLVQQQKTSEELRISSVFSVGENSSPPTVPAAPPLPSLSGAGRASAAPPRVLRMDTPPPPAPPHSATPPSAVRVSCSGCTKVLQKGQTAFQRKGSSQLFCSTVCLTGCTLPPAPKAPSTRKTCHSCLKEIVNPKDVIIAPVDGNGTVKNFCSQACLSSFDVKRNSGRASQSPADTAIKCSVCKKTAVINHEVNFQGAVHKLCSDACFTRFRSSNNLTMNCCETCGTYCYSGVGHCQLLQIEGAVRKFCSPPCLAAYKQKSGRVVPCAGCQSPRSVVDMVEGAGPESKIQLYCSGACAANANGTPHSSIAGASFPCTSCRVVAVPQFHLALNDGSIRNFCSYNCVLTFQAGLNKVPPQGQVNGSSAAPEPLSAPPSGVPLPPQTSATLPPLSAPRHGQAPPLGPGPVQAPPSPSPRAHGPALPAVLPRGPAPAQAPPSLAGGPAPPSHGLVKLSCRQCRRLFSSKPELLQFKGQMVLFCGKLCTEEYRKLNFVTARCEYCKLDKMLRDVVKFNHVDRPFCSEGCKLLFKHDLAKRTGNPCRTCAYCTNTAQKMIQNHFGGKLEEFCKEECMALYTVLFYQMAKCDWCLRQGKLLESQKWLGEMKHFCDLSCLLLFNHQQSSTYDRQHSQSSQSSPYEQPQAQTSPYEQPQAQTSPYEQPYPPSSTYEQQHPPSSTYEQQHPQLSGAIALPPHIPTGAVPACIAPLPPPAGAPAVSHLPVYASKEATPVIANVVSLASAPTGQPYVTANTALPGAVPTTLIQARINGDASTQTDAMKLPAPPRRVLKNKALLCRPISQNKGTMCKPHQKSVESQTDEVHGQKILVLPVPVPVFIPVPMHLYSQYTPLPVGLPVPLPVPLFVPPALDRTESSVHPAPNSSPDHDMAEEEEGQRDKPISYGDQGSTYSGDLESEGLSTPRSWEEEPAPGTQRLGASDQQDSPAPSATLPLLDLEADFPLESLEPESGKGLSVTLRHRGCRRPRDSFPPRKRGRKRAAAVVASGVARAAMPPAGRSKLLHMYGVNAWKSWVQSVRENRDRSDKESSVGLEEDVLRCSSAELSVGLCRFIEEVRRPNGERYTPDSIFYLCLGIQQYLFENGRIENLFTDPLYSEFSLQITSMLRDWKPAAVTNGSLLSRVEEEFLWECKQLGAYSPIVLLNTLLFFCTKLLHLQTLPEHRHLAFASLRRVTRQDSHASYLRYSPPPKPRPASEAEMTPLPVKRRLKEAEEDEEEDVMEMPENTENPLRCPVRLYEFYLSKWFPEVTKDEGKEDDRSSAQVDADLEDSDQEEDADEADLGSSGSEYVPSGGESSCDSFGFEEVAVKAGASLAAGPGDSELPAQDPRAKGPTVRKSNKVPNGKIKWDKRHYCVYCKKSNSKITRHLQQKHAAEADVALALSFPKGSQRRLQLLQQLRHKGDFRHNVAVLKKGDGELVTCKKPGFSAAASDYQPCQYCLGFFLKKDLWRHQGICKFKPETEVKSRKRVQSISSKLLPLPKENVGSCRVVLCKMNPDDVSMQVKKDPLICKFGDTLFAKHGHNETQHQYIAMKMRELARFVLALQKMDGNIEYLRDVIMPSRFDLAVEGARRVAGYDAVAGTYKASSVFLKIGYSLRKAVDIAVGESIINDDVTAEGRGKKFIQLLESKWNACVSSHTLGSAPRGKLSRCDVVPLTEDVMKLQTFLWESEETAKRELEGNPGPNAWRKLSEVLLSEIAIFNGIREDEVAKMLLETYVKRTKAAVDAEVDESLTPLEQHLAEMCTAIEFRGKFGKKISVLLTPRMAASIEVLNSARGTVGVLQDDPHVFARLEVDPPVRGGHRLREYAADSGTQHPEHLTSAKLRRRVAVLCRAMHLREDELDRVAESSGYELGVRRESGGVSENTPQLTKVRELLVAMEKGMSAHHGMPLEELHCPGTDLQPNNDNHIAKMEPGGSESTEPSSDSSPCSSAPPEPASESGPCSTAPTEPASESGPCFTAPTEPASESGPCFTAPTEPASESGPCSTAPTEPASESGPCSSAPPEPASESGPCSTAPPEPASESGPCSTAPTEPTSESGPCSTAPTEPTSESGPCSTAPTEPTSESGPCFTAPPEPTSESGPCSSAPTAPESDDGLSKPDSSTPRTRQKAETGADSEKAAAQKRQKKKSSWTVAEQTAVKSELHKFIAQMRVPGKKDCEACLKAKPDLLHNRSWKDIKYYVYNTIMSNRRRGYTCVVDVSERQERGEDECVAKKKKVEYMDR